MTEQIPVNQCTYKRYLLHREYVIMSRELTASASVKYREPAFPEDISESAIQCFLRNNGVPDCTRNTKSGDLASEVSGKLECKAFTSDGPISFTPSSPWDVLYLLDARQWKDDHFKIFRVNLKSSDEEWYNMEINKHKEPKTYKAQAEQGRRPRVNPDTLLEKVKGHTDVIYSGQFKSMIFCDMSRATG